MENVVSYFSLTLTSLHSPLGYLSNPSFSPPHRPQLEQSRSYSSSLIHAQHPAQSLARSNCSLWCLNLIVGSSPFVPAHLTQPSPIYSSPVPAATPACTVPHCFFPVLCSPPSVAPQTVPYRQDGIMSLHSWGPASSRSRGWGLINVCRQELN